MAKTTLDLNNAQRSTLFPTRARHIVGRQSTAKETHAVYFVRHLITVSLPSFRAKLWMVRNAGREVPTCVLTVLAWYVKSFQLCLDWNIPTIKLYSTIQNYFRLVIKMY